LYDGVYPDLAQDIETLISLIDVELELEPQAIQFTLPGHETATKVAVVGDFNDWQTDANLLEKKPQGWQATLDLLPGTYHYKFVIDQAHYLTDPGNPDSVYLRRYQAYNSVLQVGG
ncbi:MAG: hypothetical protein KDC54_00460, partial [Lewinella sp.]|nr:hypothetical protein [Lewinella sp.]